MSDERARLDGIAASIGPLLAALETLAFVSRYLHPPSLARLIEQTSAADDPLRAALAALDETPPVAPLEALVAQLRDAAGATMGAFDRLRRCADADNPLVEALRALRQGARALEATYPLAAVIPPVSAFFLTPAARADAAQLARLSRDERDDSTGVMHAANEYDTRGGFSVYVPEYYDPAHRVPLIMALHGGSGHGRAFLWTWLSEARSRGTIVVSPTASGKTWSLAEPRTDSAHIGAILAQVQQRWNIDPTRMMLTGMSDGGTFTLLSGLDADSPFTHLAPAATGFHPMLVVMAEPERIRGLPIFLMHGALDWMFPASTARAVGEILKEAGAHLTYREIADLSHAYPREQNAHVMDWFLNQ